MPAPCHHRRRRAVVVPASVQWIAQDRSATADHAYVGFRQRVDRARRSSQVFGGDAGVTLVEVVVAAGLMAVVLTVTGTGLSTVYQTFGRAESMAIAQQQISLSFQKLDREVRYASAVSPPALAGGDAYVEYLTTVNSVSTCVQLRLQNTTGQLQRRTWRSDTTPVSPVASTVLATQVTPGADAPSATMPFTVWPADVANSFDRLRISLRAQAGKGRTAASVTVAVTFAAVNSTPDDTNAQPCLSGRGVS